MSPGPSSPPGPSSTPGPTATSAAAVTAAASQSAAGQIAYLLYTRQQIEKAIATTPTPLTNNAVVLALYDVGIAITRALQALADQLQSRQQP